MENYGRKFFRDQKRKDLMDEIGGVIVLLAFFVAIMAFWILSLPEY